MTVYDRKDIRNSFIVFTDFETKIKNEKLLSCTKLNLEEKVSESLDPCFGTILLRLLRLSFLS